MSQPTITQLLSSTVKQEPGLVIVQDEEQQQQQQHSDITVSNVIDHSNPAEDVSDPRIGLYFTSLKRLQLRQVGTMYS